MIQVCGISILFFFIFNANTNKMRNFTVYWRSALIFNYSPLSLSPNIKAFNKYLCKALRKAWHEKQQQETQM